MANINILPTMGILIIVNYIDKYYSKKKKKSTSNWKLF